MFIDDKLIARQESLKPPIRKSLAPISSASRVDPKKPIRPRPESDAQRHSTRPKPQQEQLTAEGVEHGHPTDMLPQRPNDEDSVTMPLEEYKAMIHELHKLRELESIIAKACTFSIKELTREQARYRMTIHKDKMIHLLHHQTQQTRTESSKLPLSHREPLYREYVIKDIILED